MCGVDPLHLPVRGVFISKALYCATAWKSVSSFHLWQNMYVHAVESKPVSTSKLLLFLVIGSCVYYTLNPNTTLRIRFCSAPFLLKFSTFEHAVIPSKLMNRGWKYLLKNPGRGEGTPLTERKLGALLWHYMLVRMKACEERGKPQYSAQTLLFQLVKEDRYPTPQCKLNHFTL